MPNIPCRFYAQARCKYGSSCRFRHDGSTTPSITVQLALPSSTERLSYSLPPLPPILPLCPAYSYSGVPRSPTPPPLPDNTIHPNANPMTRRSSDGNWELNVSPVGFYKSPSVGMVWDLDHRVGPEERDCGHLYGEDGPPHIYNAPAGVWHVFYGNVKPLYLLDSAVKYAQYPGRYDEYIILILHDSNVKLDKQAVVDRIVFWMTDEQHNCAFLYPEFAASDLAENFLGRFDGGLPYFPDGYFFVGHADQEIDELLARFEIVPKKQWKQKRRSEARTLRSGVKRRRIEDSANHPVSPTHYNAIAADDDDDDDEDEDEDEDNEDEEDEETDSDYTDTIRSEDDEYYNNVTRSWWTREERMEYGGSYLDSWAERCMELGIQCVSHGVVIPPSGYSFGFVDDLGFAMITTREGGPRH